MKFENKDFVLQAVIDDVVENLREAIAGREQTLTVEMAEGETAVHADPTRISQILSNLVSNAHKYTPDGGQITLQIEKNETHAVLSVIDNGVGISEADQAKLFTQFFRAESPEVREQSGWGLGLSIVKKMVQAQGGEIDVESELGEGSAFTFSVPLATMEA
jgi:signal transduction histidine kinase